MPTATTERSYGAARARLQWVIAALILVMIPTGLVMARTLDDSLRLVLCRVHLVLGWTIVVLLQAGEAPPATLSVDQARVRHQLEAAREARTKAPPSPDAVGMADAMGIELLTEAEYRALQRLGEFYTTTSSWVLTPVAIAARGLCGALRV